MVPNIEQDDILLLGIVFYIRNIILLGLTTKISTTKVRPAVKGRRPTIPQMVRARPVPEFGGVAGARVLGLGFMGF